MVGLYWECCNLGQIVLAHDGCAASSAGVFLGTIACAYPGPQGERPVNPLRSRAARKEWIMPIRLVITTYAKPGQGAALAQAMADRCRAVQQEPGCQQFQVFQSALDPDKLVVLELWDDQAALDVHAQVNVTRTPNPPLAP